MLEALIIYVPFLIIALIDFAWFGKSKAKDDTPAQWKNRSHRYDVRLAAMREDQGYGAS